MESTRKIGLRQQTKSESAASGPARSPSPAFAAAHPILALQQQAGNQAVQQLLRAGFIQAKLTVSSPDDPEEHEADRVANRVMRSHAASPSAAPCSCTEGHENCETCRQKKMTASPSHLRGPVNKRKQCLDDYGCAWCDEYRGITMTAVDHEHCAGHCVARHEDTHASDYSLCCERYGRCLANAPIGQNPCRDAWDTYMRSISDWTECNAYNVEGECLNEILSKQCIGGSGKSGVTEDCCAQLQTELSTVTQRIGEHCPKAVQMPCPFKEDGSISRLSSAPEPQSELNNQQTDDGGAASGPARKSSPPPPATHAILALQQQAGNRAIQDLLHRGLIQAKLTVSSPGDPEEQEADQVADRVMRAHAGAPLTAPCSCADDEESCAACQAQSPKIQRRATGNPAPSNAWTGGASADALPSMLLRESGQPLDAPTRAFFEPRFGHDFSDVRVHTNAAAGESAQAINAHAYTLGSNVVFAPGRYNPKSNDGRLLLAHELAHTLQQKSKTFIHHPVHVQRTPDDSTDPAPKTPTASEFDQEYQSELANARRTGNWQAAAERLNGFNKEDIQSRLAALTSDEVARIHQGALDNPRVGPDSQLAQLTAPVNDPSRGKQLACVVRLGGCASSRDGGLPGTDDIQNYNRQCRLDSHYAGTDIYPTTEECANPPAEPLSTGEKILLGAFLVGAAAVGAAAIMVAGAEILPVVIVAVEEQATAGVAFYYANAILVNDIGVFTVGLVMSCEGNLPGLLRAVAKDPLQAAVLLAEVYMLHVNIRVQNGAPRRASVPVQMLPPEEQTEPDIKVKIVGPPQFEEESQGPKAGPVALGATHAALSPSVPSKIGPAAEIPEHLNPPAFLERGMFQVSEKPMYVVRVGGPHGNYAGVTWEINPGKEAEALGEASSYAEELAASGDAAIRSEYAIKKEWNPAIKEVSVYKVPPQTPTISGVVGPQTEGTVTYPGGAAQIAFPGGILEPVKSFPVKP